MSKSCRGDMLSLDTCRQARAYANLDSISFMTTFEVKQLKIMAQKNTLL